MSAFTLVYTRAWMIPAYSDKVNIPFPNQVKSGITTAAPSFQLVDSSADFSGIQVGDTVYSLTTNSFAYVREIIDNTTIALTENIFTAAGQNYAIYQGQNYGCYLYIPSGLDYSTGVLLEVETIGGDIVQFNNPPAGVLPVQVFKVLPATDILNIVALW